MPHKDYLAIEMGHATISPPGPFIAGSYSSLTYTYTAGMFGIDDTGGLKICFRSASDFGTPQFTRPSEPNYVTFTASNGVALQATYDTRMNIRPWAHAIFIRTKTGFLRAGDRITVIFGDTSGGSPGMHLQTNVEDTFEFRTVVDALATYEFVQLPHSPEIALIAGPPAAYRVYLPTERALGEPVRLAVVAEDRWGNSTHFPDAPLRLLAVPPLAGLEDIVTAGRGEPLVIDGILPQTEADYTVRLMDAAGTVLVTSNPMRIGPSKALRPYWADMHGQSEETIGTNSADAYFRFARDRGFLDVAGHQGNDFQITPDFWATLNSITAAYNEPGRFVTLPGYEWSGNTGMGGDRNVFYETEGQPIFRSSSVLAEIDTQETDRNHVTKLFEALSGRNVVVVPHVGGRYADLNVAHDRRLEHSVEIHSSWGTFEWLLHDALALGSRAGIVCNSDDHKGRQGATRPGDSMFGAIGGLTCLMMPELDRSSVFHALRTRRHYGTTGCRMFLHVQASVAADAELFDRDPALFDTQPAHGTAALMGHIVRTTSRETMFRFDAVGSAPVDRVDVFNGLARVATFRGFDAKAIAGSRRIRVLWEGAEYRGRGRQTCWDGSAELVANSIVQASSVNFLNPDNPLVQDGPARLSWKSFTTGNMAGFDVLLADPDAGDLHIATGPASATVAVRDIGLEDIVIEADGLYRRIRIFRLPEQDIGTAVSAELAVTLQPGVDNPLFARVTQTDGHQAWSSPIYFIA